jgi:anthranilate phosphoribosyltransferase
MGALADCRRPLRPAKRNPSSLMHAKQFLANVRSQYGTETARACKEVLKGATELDLDQRHAVLDGALAALSRQEAATPIRFGARNLAAELGRRR